MMGIKSAAIGVAALGSAAVGSDVYLSAHDRAALHSSWPRSVPEYDRAMSVAPEALPTEAARTADGTVFIEQVTIHPSAFYRPAFTVDGLWPAGSLAPAPCVDWGSSVSPAEHGLWMSCFTDSTPASSP